mgnify:CR=1
MSESEQLKDLSDLRWEVVDTSDSNNKSDLSFGWDEEGVFSSSLSSLADKGSLFLLVSLVVGFTSLSIFNFSSLGQFSSLGNMSLSAFSQLSVSGSLLQQVLRHWDLRFLDFHFSGLILDSLQKL